jgi:hypothetical protein
MENGFPEIRRYRNRVPTRRKKEWKKREKKEEKEDQEGGAGLAVAAGVS